MGRDNVGNEIERDQTIKHQRDQVKKYQKCD